MAARLGAGAQVATTPAEVAARSTIVITMLPHGEVVQQVALGEAGLVHGLRPGALLLDWLVGRALDHPGHRRGHWPGTAQPWSTPWCQGAAWGAAAADLVFMVGGGGGRPGPGAPLARPHGPCGVPPW
ncbi:MAG: NAD(P)-binding domain-containing protein [Ideonella sp.]|nr:NAD(P)-binding domain-containing protein [Ideonella sp.]